MLAAAYVAGYFLKGITGFAEAVPIIGIGSFFVDPLELVGMLTIADLAGGMVVTAIVLAVVSQAVETGMFIVMLSITGIIFLLFIFHITCLDC